MNRPKELEALQELARVATREALKEYEPVPEEWRENLTLGTYFEGDVRVFELYVAQEKPANAIVISSARVDRKTKAVEVAITNLKKKGTS